MTSDLVICHFSGSHGQNQLKWLSPSLSLNIYERLSMKNQVWVVLINDKLTCTVGRTQGTVEEMTWCWGCKKFWTCWSVHNPDSHCVFFVDFCTSSDFWFLCNYFHMRELCWRLPAEVLQRTKNENLRNPWLSVWQ